jgi:phosphoglycolate phosphatase
MASPVAVTAHPAVALFDLDGTLTDSQSGIIASYQHALAEFGLRASDETIRRWIGPPLIEGMTALGVPTAQVADAVDVYRGYFSTVGILENHLYPGIEEALARLGTAGVQLGVATSKLTEYAVRIVEQLQISECFSVVAGATRDGTRIHKDEIIRHALGELGEPDPSTVTMVGDREHDMFGAVACGVRPIGITWGYGSRAELTAAGAQSLIGDPAQLVDLLLDSSHP